MNKTSKLLSVILMLISMVFDRSKPLSINAQEDYTVIANLQVDTFAYNHLNYTTFSTVEYYVNLYGTTNPAYIENTDGYTIYADFIQLFIPNVEVYAMTCDNYSTALNCFVSTITFFNGTGLPFESFAIGNLYNLTGWTTTATLISGWSKLITVPRGTQSIGVELYGRYDNTQVASRRDLLSAGMRIDMIEANYQLVLPLNTFTNSTSNTNKIIKSELNFIPNSRRGQMLLLLPTNNNAGTRHLATSGARNTYASVQFYDNNGDLITTVQLIDDIYNGNYKNYLCDPYDDETEEYGRFCAKGYYYINLSTSQAIAQAVSYTLTLTNNKNGWMTSSGEALPVDWTTTELSIYTQQIKVFYDNDINWAQFKSDPFTQFDLRPYGLLVNQPNMSSYDTSTNLRTNLINEDFSHWYLINDKEKRPFDFTDEQKGFITLIAYYGDYIPPFNGLSPISPLLPDSFITLLDGFGLYNDAGFVFLFIIVLLIVNFFILYYQLPKTILIVANLSIVVLFTIFGMIPLFVLILSLASLTYSMIMTFRNGGAENG